MTSTSSLALKGQHNNHIKLSLVLLAIVCQDEVLEGHLYTYPLLVSEGGPDVMGLRDGGFVRLQDDLGTVCVYVEGSQNQNQTRECLRACMGGGRGVKLHITLGNFDLLYIQMHLGKIKTITVSSFYYLVKCMYHVQCRYCNNSLPDMNRTCIHTHTCTHTHTHTHTRTHTHTHTRTQGEGGDNLQYRRRYS